MPTLQDGIFTLKKKKKKIKITLKASLSGQHVHSTMLWLAIWLSCAANIMWCDSLHKQEDSLAVVH